VSFFEKLETIKIGTFSLNALFSAIVILIVCVIIMNIIMKIVDRYLGKTKMEKGLKNFVRTAFKVLLWVVIILLVADCLNIPITSLVALLSIAGLALSLSLQNLLANLFSGLTILATHPFRVDDLVQIGDKLGTVKEIGLFYTTVTTPENYDISIPNNTVTAADIQNFSVEDKRRVDIEFAVPSSVSTMDVRKAVITASEKDPKIMTTPSPFVAINKLGPAVEYVCRVYCRNDDYWDVYFGLTEAIRESFLQNNIGDPVPGMNINVTGLKTSD